MREGDEYEDRDERRNVRYEYRQLITDTEQKRNEYVQSNVGDVHQVIKEGNELYRKVRRTREAALDGQFFVLTSDIGFDRGHHVQTGVVTFQPRTFAEKLITFMGGRRVDDGTDEDGNLNDVCFESLDWKKIGKIAANSFSTTPAIEFMHGPLSMDAPVKKTKQRGPKKKTGDKPGAAAKVTPEQLVQENSNEEATTKEVQRVYEALVSVTDPGGLSFHDFTRKILGNDDEELKPVSFFEFVTNPESFGQTVENIFHLSFLINKGNAAIEQDEDGLPTVYPTDPYSEKDYGNEVVTRKQVVMPFTMEDWENIVDIYKIEKPIIPTRKATHQAATQDDHVEEE